MTSKERIGFSFIARRDWLNVAATLAIEYANSDICQGRLEDAVSSRLSGIKSRKNTITILNRIWLNPLPRAEYFRDRGMSLYKVASDAERVALHCAMSSLAFTFFYDCITILGRLSNLQDEFNISQVLRRIHERWGEKPKTAISLSAVVASIVDWGILKRTGRPGSYIKNAPILLNDEISLFLVEALAVVSGLSIIPMRDLLTHPSLFPFKFELSAGIIAASHVLDLQHSGANEPVLVINDKYFS